jgi:hypothetical protein
MQSILEQITDWLKSMIISGTGRRNVRSAQRGPRFRRTVLDTIKHIINKQRPPGNLPAGAAVFRGTLFFLPYFAASTSTPT